MCLEALVLLEGVEVDDEGEGKVRRGRERSYIVGNSVERQ
jgi:hypothetical protein